MALLECAAVVGFVAKTMKKRIVAALPHGVRAWPSLLNGAKFHGKTLLFCWHIGSPFHTGIFTQDGIVNAAYRDLHRRYMVSFRLYDNWGGGKAMARRMEGEVGLARRAEDHDGEHGGDRVPSPCR